jgi:hypothetical protein
MHLPRPQIYFKMPPALKSLEGSSFRAMCTITSHMCVVIHYSFSYSRLICTFKPGPEQTSISPPLDLMDDTFSDCEIYCNQMLRRKRGFPLYVPEPPRNLPTEYRKIGIQIGDVGRVTPEGIFDFFFNIYLPADHPINDNDVPENFYPLPWHYSSKDVFDLSYAARSCLSTSSVENLNLDALS